MIIGNSKLHCSEVNKQAKCRNREASLKKTL
ncbi:hypothetical protein T4C_14039 [Trichinella pseudospiralis]|uniref:Uncharacterized protein n=1 Tax=Trichinella pseudospiralis TaxID=6337 RepID=A0A0V1GPZ9_TRIPS|nr:hypothetical protein T4C_14039 [Trichinella pseudospiralis]